MDFDKCEFCRWENIINGRYYLAHVKQDLLDDWVVMVCWGKVGTNLGRLKTVFCESEKKSVEHLKKINRDRVRHGYILSIREGYSDAGC